MVISRRALLGTGAATAVVAAGLGGAALMHRLDDLARGVGIEPHSEPDPADDRLIARVAADQNALLARVEATASKHTALRLDPFVAISTAHAKAVGVAATVPDIAAPPANRDTAIRTLATGLRSRLEGARGRLGQGGLPRTGPRPRVDVGRARPVRSCGG